MDCQEGKRTINNKFWGWGAIIVLITSIILILSRNIYLQILAALIIAGFVTINKSHLSTKFPWLGIFFNILVSVFGFINISNALPCDINLNSLSELAQQTTTKAFGIFKKTVIFTTKEYSLLNKMDEIIRTYEAQCYDQNTSPKEKPKMIWERLESTRLRISKTEQTNFDINNRYNNIQTRENLDNIRRNKIIKREENKNKAHKITNPVYVPSIQHFELEPVDITANHERISYHISKINETLNNSTETESCKWDILDFHSFEIVKELNEIQQKQEILIKKLTAEELYLNKVELSYQIKEEKISKTGY